MIEEFKSTADFILQGIDYRPKIGIVLGSGLGGLGDKIKVDKAIAYKDIPHFPISTVDGHKGELLLGSLGNKKVVAMQGRFHYYENYEMNQLTFPIRVMKFLGIEILIVSNASGGINPTFNVGDIMIIRDHINNFPENPLRGYNYHELGPRFPDMSKTYDSELISRAHKIASAHGIKLQEGVYIGSPGPTLETPAEYKMFRIWGADATGMSTVPEVIVAHHMGIRVLGLSIITNTDKPSTPDGETTHDEVQDVAGRVEPQMTTIITELINEL